jgi:ectoine hydroxylase-related dioxygenase (phytanoyl-CoA dioxygenase family)
VRSRSTVKGHAGPSISLLADPSLFSGDPGAFERLLSFVASARICALLDGLALPGEARTPRVKKSDYYHEQTRRDWDGDWHRDSQFLETEPERERALISSTTSVHVRVAFEPDDRLELVPGSQLRWDTPEELRVRKGNQRAAPAMPRAVRVVLRAGEACIFHAWSIHRATYRRTPLRRTLDSLYAFGEHPTERFIGH